MFFATEVQYATHCPECGSELIRLEDQAAHFCPNETHCPPQVVGKMIHYVSRKALNIENLGSETIEQLYRRFTDQHCRFLHFAQRTIASIGKNGGKICPKHH